MKRLQTWVILGAFSALSATLGYAAEAEIKAQADVPDVHVKANADRDRIDVKSDRADRDLNTRVIDARAAREGAIKKENKASGLLGMEVRNKDNEKLGEIKDLALDLNSGKVSYAVLAVGGFLGLGEKLLAVPTSALQVSTDHGYMVLDADKAKIQAAPGFAATNWPRLEDQASFNSYWSTGRASGAPAGAEIRTESGNKLRSEADLRREKSDKLYTDAKEKEHSVSANADVGVDTKNKSVTLDTRTDNTANRADYKVLHGKVSSVDAKHQKIVVQTDTGEKRVFNLDNQATLRVGKGQNVHLDDFKTGYDVDIRYDSVNGRLVAHSIEKTTP
jgi:sporulation protein YlmC with PRC-barrel domain